jgi:predicted O-methyltransferase YrrM
METLIKGNFEDLHRELDKLKIRQNIANLTRVFNHHVALENTAKIVKPKEILEIGFLCGHTSLMWLMFSEANVTSVDNVRDASANKAIAILDVHFGDRFRFLKEDIHEMSPLDRKYDLLFMDAGLDDEALSALDLAEKAGIPYLLFDCWNHNRYIPVLEKAKKEGRIESIVNYRTSPATLKLYKLCTATV